ncbi:MAG: PIG-L family deacetylase [Caldilineaceae bacterium]|nr:PIG-L family deacetylase [Caldilineaceae bacterium]MCB9139295.1 PIG-L family deacetylase [Caldilineaceae bacterium]
MTYKLLGVFAHPDDESFGPGATLARYARQGAAVDVIIATDGIAGSVSAETKLSDHSTLAQVRSTELANAAVALGLRSIWSLPYRDSGMRGTPDNDHPDALIRQPVEALTAEILGYIRRLQPNVIITHDPFGGYGHPDHVRVCEAATAAFYLARSEPESATWRGPEKLYYTAFDKRWLRFIVRVLPLMGQDPTAVGRNKDIDLVEISGWETPVHAEIQVGDYLPEKDAASQAHASQYDGGAFFTRGLPQTLRRRLMGQDRYTRAYPAPNGIMERDLFAGVTSNE